MESNVIIVIAVGCLALFCVILSHISLKEGRYIYSTKDIDLKDCGYPQKLLRVTFIQNKKGELRVMEDSVEILDK